MRITLYTGGAVDGLALGPAFALLDAVAAAPSLLAAAKTLGISYRSAWSRLAGIEAALGRPVVIKTKGHGTVLTPYGAALHASLADSFRRLKPALAAEEARLPSPAGAGCRGAEAVPDRREPRPPPPRRGGGQAGGRTLDRRKPGRGRAASLGRGGCGGLPLRSAHRAAAALRRAPARSRPRRAPLFDREQGFMLPPATRAA